jgi:DNA-directed RNA polymerase specialized sigma24 family protein
MSDTKGSVSIWIDHLKNGEDDAVAALWQRYFIRLIDLAHKRLAGLPSRNEVAEDVAASVFNSFCHRAGDSGFQRLDDRGDLWQLLAVLTTRKAVSARRREKAAKRGAGKVRVASELAMASDDDVVDLFGNMSGAEPTPEEAAIAAEEFQRLLDILGDEQLRQVALSRLEGYTNVEIATRLGLSLATVERKVALVRGRWQGELAE